MHLQLRIFFRPLNIVGIGFVVPDHIRFARLQAGEARLRIRQRLDDNAIEVDAVLVPVIRIPFQHHAVARGP
jgi:hypothetical protein